MAVVRKEHLPRSTILFEPQAAAPSEYLDKVLEHLGKRILFYWALLDLAAQEKKRVTCACYK